MVKPIVALLTLLLVLVGPASAQGSDPSGDPAAEDGATGPEEPQSGDQAEEADPPESGSDPEDPATTTSGTATEQQQRACRLAVTHIGDPTMSPNRWIIPDPDGCVRRTVDRIVGTVTNLAPPIVRSLL